MTVCTTRFHVNIVSLAFSTLTGPLYVCLLKEVNELVNKRSLNILQYKSKSEVFTESQTIFVKRCCIFKLIL